MNRSLLFYLACPECRQEELFLKEAVDHAGQSIEKGELHCPSCHACYPIEDGIPDFTPATLRNRQPRAAASGTNRLFPQHTAQCEDAQKLGQIIFFAGCAEEYEAHITNSPYYRAFEQLIFKKWVHKNLKPGSAVLDLGCGTGRSMPPLARQGHRILGVDLSRPMLLAAQKRNKQLHLSEQIDLILGDADKIPLKSRCIDACVINGTLHHLFRPASVLQRVAQTMKPGSPFYSCDPHKSPVRFIFDWAMKVWKLHDEEASGDPLFSERRLKRMLEDVGIFGKIKFSTYLLPHFFHFFSHRTNLRLLQLTDNLFSRIPLIQRLAGIIVMQAALRR